MHHSKHWMTYFALEGLDQVIESLESFSHLPSIRLSEYSFEHGRFTLLLLSRAINSFRQTHATPIELFRLDLSGLNYPEMIRIAAEEPESYTQHPECYTYFTQGNFFMGRLHPEKSIALHVASHILSGVRVRVPAPDTFFPSESGILEIRNARRQHAIEDLVAFLNNRHKELIDGGRIYFDVMGSLPEGNNLRTSIDKVLFKALDLKIIPESFRGFSIMRHFWEKEQVMAALGDVKELLEVVSYKEVEILMPSYKEYLQDNDGLKYANNLSLFWSKALDWSFRSHFKGELTDNEYKNINTNIQQMIIADFVIDPPICKCFSHHIVLRKS